MLRYNYIYFTSPDNKLHKDSDGYYTICLKDLEEYPGEIKIIYYPLIYANYFIKKLFLLHTSRRVNKIINLPFKNFWYPYYFEKTNFTENKPICFVVASGVVSLKYILYLKKKYPDAKFVNIYRDKFAITNRLNNEYTLDSTKKVFDLRMSFDEGEAQKYGMSYFSEFESKIDVPISPDYPLSDVFFAGKAKDRLPRLLQAYEILSASGLKCKFYLTGVPAKQRVKYPDIEYADKPMKYKEMLYQTVNSKCVLEINQYNVSGYTSRFLEAVIYGKKLITDNVSIRKHKFFKTGYIQCIDNVSDIDPKFVNDDVVDYHYNQEFSPVVLIRQIDKELSQ